MPNQDDAFLRALGIQVHDEQAQEDARVWARCLRRMMVAYEEAGFTSEQAWLLIVNIQTTLLMSGFQKNAQS